MKSDYKVHRAVVQRAQQSSRSGGLEGSRKVKHFLWRMSHNTLAVHMVLQRRGMKLDTRCCMCGRYDEDGGHLLKCKEVREVWRELNLEDVRCELMTTCSVVEMMEKFFKLEPNQQSTIVTLLWLWWKERNRWREEGRRGAGREVAYMVAS